MLLTMASGCLRNLMPLPRTRPSANISKPTPLASTKLKIGSRANLISSDSVASGSGLVMSALSRRHQHAPDAEQQRVVEIFERRLMPVIMFGLEQAQQFDSVGAIYRVEQSANAC